jgi:hypothetical protein
VPVSVSGSNVENFEAGMLMSSTGPVLVMVRQLVVWSVRNVDRSECVVPGVWPGGSPEALPLTQPTAMGWIVAVARDDDQRGSRHCRGHQLSRGPLSLPLGTVAGGDPSL